MKITTCNGCGAEIVFMPTMKGKQNPVNLDSFTPPADFVGTVRQYVTSLPAHTMFNRDTHMSHFNTCPDAAKFKKAQADPKPAKEEKAEPESTQVGLFSDEPIHADWCLTARHPRDVCNCGAEKGQQP